MRKTGTGSITSASCNFCNQSDCKAEVLKETDQSNIDYRGADFCDLDLISTNFSDSDLRGALLSNSKLNQANLTKTDLRGADLKGADLTDADLTSTDFRGAKYDDQTVFPQRLDLKYEGLELEGSDDQSPA